MLLHQELTQQIIGRAMLVSRELGTGFLESVYHNALVMALNDIDIQTASQRDLTVFFQNRAVGTFFADIVVGGKVIVELKAVHTVISEHKAQLIHYLKATRLEVGLLINFGNPKLEFHRVVRTIDREPSTEEEPTIETIFYPR